MSVYPLEGNIGIKGMLHTDPLKFSRATAPLILGHLGRTTEVPLIERCLISFIANEEDSAFDHLDDGCSLAS
jgi:hypothetical protein